MCACAALQMFDVYSTQRAISGGAREANPLMTTVVGNKATFYAVKAVSTVAPMLLAVRVWKKNKIAAIADMNTAMKNSPSNWGPPASSCSACVPRISNC